MTSEDSEELSRWEDLPESYRVYWVATTTQRPKTACDIAEEADVDQTTVTKHLDRLVDLGILRRETVAGESKFSPDPLDTRMVTVRDLIDSNDVNDLREMKTDLERRIERWSEEYGVNAPTELLGQFEVHRSEGETRDVAMTFRYWTLVEYRLHRIERAIEDYDRYSYR